MLNPYSIILGVFVFTGFLVTVWGSRIIITARKTSQWPWVEGTIIESRLDSSQNDIFPKIRYEFSVNGNRYERALTFPADVTPTQEYSEQYINKYPSHAKVKVYYNPLQPGLATLEPGLAKGDWLVVAIGLSMMVIGALLILSAN